MIDIVATVECAGGVVFHPVFTVRYAYLCGYRIR